MSTWELQKSLMAGHAGKGRSRLDSSPIRLPKPTLKTCPTCGKSATVETYCSTKDGLQAMVELTRCHGKCPPTKTILETGEQIEMPQISHELKVRYQTARRRLQLTHEQCAEMLGIPARSMSSIMSARPVHAAIDRLAAIEELVAKMEGMDPAPAPRAQDSAPRAQAPNLSEAIQALMGVPASMRHELLQLVELRESANALERKLAKALENA